MEIFCHSKSFLDFFYTGNYKIKFKDNEIRNKKLGLTAQLHTIINVYAQFGNGMFYFLPFQLHL